MSGISQAGVIIAVILFLMFLSARDGNARRGSHIRDEDAETWWYARRKWWDDRR